LTGCGSPAPAAPVSTLTGELPVRAPQSIQAGATAEIIIGPVAAAKSGTPVRLVAVGSYGPRIYQGAFDGAQARFVLPGEDTRQSGYMSLTAISGEAIGETGLTITAGAMVEPVVPLVGSRAIPADGEHWSMVVVVPSDVYGNPAPDGTEVSLRALHPGNRVEDKTVQVNHLLAWQRLFSGTQAGHTIITAAVGDAHGPESDLLEVAGWPQPFSLTNEPTTLPADGRQLMKLRSSVIRDKFDNVIPDGTLVTILVKEGGELKRSLPAYTLGGIAETTLQAPSQPGVIEVYGVVYGMEGQHLQITFTAGPAVDVFPVNVVKDPVNRVVRLEAGPLLGALGQFIPDGTPVVFRLTDSRGQRQLLTASALGGRASFELRLVNLLPGAYSVEASVGAGHGAANFKLP
jgi:hypothetical protein